ncbi:MAG: hypothetical protein J5653_07465 [Clostridiales bacterium]|nr:hypothetical protein [Clostridiales bacterium]
MDWKTFYDSYEAFEQDELVQKFLNLSDYGPAKEIVEVLDDVDDDQDIRTIVLKAADKGAFDSVKALEELEMSVSTKVLDQVIEKFAEGRKLSMEDLERLGDIASEDKFSELLEDQLDMGVAFTADEIETLDEYLNNDDVLIRLIEEVKAPLTIEDIENLDFLLPDGERIDDVLAARGDLSGALLEWEKENNMDGDFDDLDDIDGDY